MQDTSLQLFFPFINMIVIYIVMQDKGNKTYYMEGGYI